MVVDDGVRFALSAEGEIVLGQDASRLVGEFRGGQTWLPVVTGTLELTRPSVTLLGDGSRVMLY